MREKENYRATLEFLTNVKSMPLMLQKKQVADLLGVHYNTVLRWTKSGKLKTIGNKVPLTAVASYLC